MARMLMVCALLVLPARFRAADPPPPSETIVRFTLSPAPAPRPALRFRLLPGLTESNPGNPVQGYLFCFMEQHTFFFNKEIEEQRDKWASAPLAELPREQMRGYGGQALKNADWAARLETPDWQILAKLKRDGISTLIPDVQQMRRIALALKVRMRGEIADGRFDDAVYTAQTMLALARHLGEHPTLIGNLVGIAVGVMATGPLEELIGQPGSPNLYWALTDLPSPLVEIRKGLLGERLWPAHELGLLPDNVAMDETEVRRALSRIVEFGKLLDGPNSKQPKLDPPSWLGARAKDDAFLSDARKRLIDAGLKAEIVKTFPPMQVVLLDDKREMEERRDEVMKGMLLPWWQLTAIPQAAPIRESMLSDLVPATYRIRALQARLEQRIGLLRHVEAIRIFMAAHDGKLPSKSEELTVPLPLEPFSGKPYHYQIDGETAKVWGEPPPGADKNPSIKVRYEITVRK